MRDVDSIRKVDPETADMLEGVERKVELFGGDVKVKVEGLSAKVQSMKKDGPNEIVNEHGQTGGGDGRERGEEPGSRRRVDDPSLSSDADAVQVDDSSSGDANSVRAERPKRGDSEGGEGVAEQDETVQAGEGEVVGGVGGAKGDGEVVQRIEEHRKAYNERFASMEEKVYTPQEYALLRDTKPKREWWKINNYDTEKSLKMRLARAEAGWAEIAKERGQAKENCRLFGHHWGELDSFGNTECERCEAVGGVVVKEAKTSWWARFVAWWRRV